MEKLDVLVVEYITPRVLFFIERFGHHKLDIADNIKLAIDYLENEIYDYVFIGGELGQGNGSGVDVAEFLVNNPANPNNYANIIIHSWNPVEALQMVNLLPKAKYEPFSEKTLSVLDI